MISLLSLLSTFLHLLEILLLVRVLLSFMPQLGATPWGRLVVSLTEPFLAPLRPFLRIGAGPIGLDFSPMVAMILIQIVRSLLWV